MQVMDATALTFPDHYYDAVVAKATFDSILCGENSTANAAKLCTEVRDAARVHEALSRHWQHALTITRPPTCLPSDPPASTYPLVCWSGVLPAGLPRVEARRQLRDRLVRAA